MEYWTHKPNEISVIGSNHHATRLRAQWQNLAITFSQDWVEEWINVVIIDDSVGKFIQDSVGTWYYIGPLADRPHDLIFSFLSC